MKLCWGLKLMLNEAMDQRKSFRKLYLIKRLKFEVLEIWGAKGKEQLSNG